VKTQYPDKGLAMISPLRTCLPLAIAAALIVPSLPADAQQRQIAVQPAPAPPPPPKPKHGPTPPPIACAKRLAGVDAAQTESFNFWLRTQGPIDQIKVQFSCKLDRSRLIVGLVSNTASADGDSEGPAKHTVHMLDLALDPPPARLLRRNLIEGAVVIVRPGGGMSLVFGETTVERGLAYKGYRAVDINTGKVFTFFSLPMEPTGLGCVTGRAMGLERIWVASEAVVVDLGENGPYGVAVEHEDGDCKAGKNEKRLDTFIAVPDGFEAFK
jgi:hypothetical protein